MVGRYTLLALSFFCILHASVAHATGNAKQERSVATGDAQSLDTRSDQASNRSINTSSLNASRPIPADSLGEMTSKEYLLKEIEIVGGTVKQHDAAVGRSIKGISIEPWRIRSMRQLSSLFSNLHIPDYGSKMTSSVYIRGIGARIDQPALGLYVDNIPYLNKNNYDFSFLDIDQLSIKKGPQSTLYGRNTIGGVLLVKTLSPLNFQGIRAALSYGSGNSMESRISVYEKPSEKVGYMIGAAYNRSDGFYRNEFDGSKCDWLHEMALRSRVAWQPTSAWKFDNTLSIGKVRQGGFAYAAYDTTTHARGPISHNDPCRYDRLTLTEGLSVSHDGARSRLSSVTSYQYTDDRMTLDQDFSPKSLFTMIQAQKEHALSEDLNILSTDASQRWQWLCGVFGFYKHNTMTAPVTFKRGGIDELILKNTNAGIQSIFPSDSIMIAENQFIIGDDFRIPTWGAALYHQSVVHLGRWELTGGLRLDYEHASMRYDNSGALHYRFTMTMPEYAELNTAFDGRETLSYWELLPRVAASYRFGRANRLYASIAKGYKAGGFNTQIFSDIVQSRMMNDMMSALGVYPDGVGGSTYNNASATSYRPEHNWNYELGGRLSADLGGGTLGLDGSLFYIDCRDQQLTIFPPGKSTGRMMSNAGRTRSYGVEASFQYAYRNFQFSGSYGYTNARFIDYTDGKIDYTGRYLPYAPRQTVSLNADYQLPLRGWFDRLLLHCAWQGVGRIYWNELNTLSQPFYGQLSASAGITRGATTFMLWGSNLTGADFDTFYFMSVGNSFVQRGKPRQIGVSILLNLNKK